MISAKRSCVHYKSYLLPGGLAKPSQDKAYSSRTSQAVSDLNQSSRCKRAWLRDCSHTGRRLQGGACSHTQRDLVSKPDPANTRNTCTQTAEQQMVTDESNDTYTQHQLYSTQFTQVKLSFGVCVSWHSVKTDEPIARLYNFDFIIECHLVGLSWCFWSVSFSSWIMSLPVFIKSWINGMFPFFLIRASAYIPIWSTQRTSPS